MSSRIAKEEMALMMPNSIGHYFKDDLSEMPANNGRPSLFDRIARALAYIANMPRRRAVMQELYSLTEHELADIGLTRAELPMVFDAQFAAQRNAANGNQRTAPGRKVAA